MDKELAQALLDDWLNKKDFAATWQGDCDICGNMIEESDYFIFYAAKQKCCDDCQGKITESLEVIIENGV